VSTPGSWRWRAIWGEAHSSNGSRPNNSPARERLLALYKYSEKVRRSGDKAFDALQVAGAQTPHPGIYRCEGCGVEIVSSSGSPLPTQHHYQHMPDQGPIRWRMIVYAERPGV